MYEHYDKKDAYVMNIIIFVVFLFFYFLWLITKKKIFFVRYRIKILYDHKRRIRMHVKHYNKKYNKGHFIFIFFLLFLFSVTRNHKSH